MSPTTPVGIVFFKQTPFYSITWKHPVVVASSAYDRVQWQPYLAGQAAGSGGHAQVGGHPIQPIFAVESLTNNDYNNISLLRLVVTQSSPSLLLRASPTTTTTTSHYSARRSPLPLSTCGDQEDGRWSTPGWRSLGEDGGGGFSTNLFTFSQQTVVERKSFVTKIV